MDVRPSLGNAGKAYCIPASAGCHLSRDSFFGSNPTIITILGDIIWEPGPPITDKALKELLSTLRKNASLLAVITVQNHKQAVNMPENLDTVSHVYIKKGKLTPLGHSYDEQLPILAR